MPTSPLPIAFLLSGGGTTLQNLIDLQQAGELDVDIRLVISSRPEAKGLQRAQRADIPTTVIARQPGSEQSFSKQINDAIRSCGAKLVCMGGFLSMWIIPPDYEHKVLNIHPALLPSFGGKGFYGSRVHQAVLDAGCKISGCTVHFADNIYDNGPIVLQESVTVLEDDTAETLAERVQGLERRLYPQAIRLFSEGRLHVEGQRVRINTC